jgi:hypothetical protein
MVAFAIAATLQGIFFFQVFVVLDIWNERFGA